LPGIGRDIAVRLLEKFGSVEKVVTADEDELAEVEGIGKIKAKRIRAILS
jgi:ERCC4-type nuclease